MPTSEQDSWVSRTFGVDLEKMGGHGAHGQSDRKVKRFEDRFKAFSPTLKRVTSATISNDATADALRNKVAEPYAHIRASVRANDFDGAQRYLDQAMDASNAFLTYAAEHSSITFGEAFKRCMKTMHMPCPDGIFESGTKVLEVATAITVAVEKFGTGVTVAEIAGAGLLSEVLLAVGAVSAAGYAGACVGCSATATGDVLMAL